MYNFILNVLNVILAVIFDESIIKKISETKEKHNPKNDMHRGKILKYKKVLSKIFFLEYQKFYTFNKLKSLNVIFTYVYLFNEFSGNKFSNRK